MTDGRISSSPDRRLRRPPRKPPRMRPRRRRRMRPRRRRMAPRTTRPRTPPRRHPRGRAKRCASKRASKIMPSKVPMPNASVRVLPARGRIAVLGAGGFLGSHLIEVLLDRSRYDIDAVDCNLTKLETRDPRVHRFAARIEDPGLVEEVVSRCGVVLSLTALCNPALYSTQPLEVIDANYADLVPLVKTCAKHHRRLIHFSTCEVYGRTALDATGRPMAEMNEEKTGFF